MPNWCTSTLIIETHFDKKLYKQFTDWLEFFEGDYIQGHRPDSIKCDSEDLYLFNICKTSDDVYCFESKWSPPISIMIKIAKHYKFSFEMEYEEPDDLLYGKMYCNPRTRVYKYKNVDMNEYPGDDVDDRYSVLDNLPEKSSWLDV